MKFLVTSTIMLTLSLGTHADETTKAQPATKKECPENCDHKAAKAKADKPVPAPPEVIRKAQANAASKQPSTSRTRRRQVVLPPSTATPRPPSPSSSRVVRPPSSNTNKRVPVPPNQARTRVGTRVVNPQAPAPEQEKQNITLRWNGSFYGNLDLDLELTGSGPLFQIDSVAPSEKENDLPPPIITISAQVAEKGAKYNVDYSVGARVAVVTSSFQRAPGQGLSTNIEFRDITLSGSVQLKPGEPVALVKQNGKKLSLTIIKGE